MKKMILCLSIILIIILSGCSGPSIVSNPEVDECSSACFAKSRGSDRQNDPKQLNKKYCESYCQQIEEQRGTEDVKKLTVFFNNIREDCFVFIQHIMGSHDELTFGCLGATNMASLYGGKSSVFLPEKELES